MHTWAEANRQAEGETIHDRVLAVLESRTPDRLPFVDRLGAWYRRHLRGGTLPEAFREVSLSEIHRALGMGEQVFVFPCSMRLNGVEVVCRCGEEIIYRDSSPRLDHFPEVYDLIPAGKAGVFETVFSTPVGDVSIEHEVLQSTIEMGIERPYPRRHPIQDEADYHTVEYILERAEPTLESLRIWAELARIGGHGWVVPMLRRIPFQQLLLEYLGEESLFYALHDCPKRIERLTEVLDIYLTKMLQLLAGLPVPYVEFGDNLEGAMTNPRLYARYGLPFHQRYSETLHAQGKKVGSHTDGNLRPLLRLLAESGLDVCESVTPAPTTECTLKEILAAWEKGPLVWGGIPSSFLDPHTSDQDFEQHIDALFQDIAGRAIILGIGDMVMPEASVERIRHIADRVERHAVGGG